MIGVAVAVAFLNAVVVVIVVVVYFLQDNSNTLGYASDATI